jgi:hypothetical protein
MASNTKSAMSGGFGSYVNLGSGYNGSGDDTVESALSTSIPSSTTHLQKNNSERTRRSGKRTWTALFHLAARRLLVGLCIS